MNTKPLSQMNQSETKEKNIILAGQVILGPNLSHLVGTSKCPYCSLEEAWGAQV